MLEIGFFHGAHFLAFSKEFSGQIGRMGKTAEFLDQFV